MPRNLRCASRAAIPVDPEPQKGSRTRSPLFVKDLISGSSADTGFCVGCMVSAIAHVDNVGDRLSRNLGLSLRQQISLLMLISEKSRLRAVLLAKHQVSDDTESCLTPCPEELICVCPAVERDHETTFAQNSIRFRESGLEP